MNKNIQIQFTKEQYKEMIFAAMLYSWICGGLADRNDKDFKKYEELQNYLLTLAKENGLYNLIEEFEGGLLPSEELMELEEKTMEEHDDDTFWHELVTRLGRRDFWQTVTPEEKEEIEKRGWLTERVDEIYEMYEREFEERGVDRLRLEKN